MIDTKEFNLQFSRNVNLGKHYKVGDLLDEIESLRNIVRAVLDGFEPDPGTSDLDNEQPIHVCMPLGVYRKARMLP